MARGRGAEAEVARRLDEAPAEEMAPHAVDEHPGRQRVVGGGDRVGQLPAAAPLGKRRTAAEHGEEVSRDLRAAPLRLPAEEDDRIDRLRLVDEHERPRWRAGMRRIDLADRVFQIGNLAAAESQQAAGLDAAVGLEAEGGSRLLVKQLPHFLPGAVVESGGRGIRSPCFLPASLGLGEEPTIDSQHGSRVGRRCCSEPLVNERVHRVRRPLRDDHRQFGGHPRIPGREQPYERAEYGMPSPRLRADGRLEVVGQRRHRRLLELPLVDEAADRLLPRDLHLVVAGEIVGRPAAEIGLRLVAEPGAVVRQIGELLRPDLLVLGDKAGGRRSAGDPRQLLRLLAAREDAVEPVVVGGRDRVVLVVVAPGAGDRQPEEAAAHDVDPVGDLLVGFVDEPGPDGEEPERREVGVVGRSGMGVGGDLQPQEAIERHVVVEGPHDPVAVGPRERVTAVDTGRDEVPRVGIASHVEPVAAPPLAVPGRGEHPFDE